VNRDNILAVRMTATEREAAEQLADMEKLPLSTLVRRQLLQQAESRGVCSPIRVPEGAESEGRSTVQRGAIAAY
jgi:hypothetical protein